jgi:hypothetical protein
MANKKEKNPIKELSVFGIGFGIMLAIMAYINFTTNDSPYNLWGMKRSFAIGLPLTILSIFHFSSGLYLLLSKLKIAALLCVYSSIFSGMAYFLFEISTIGFFSATFVSFLVYSIPILHFIKIGKVLEAIKNQNISEVV